MASDAQESANSPPGDSPPTRGDMFRLIDAALDSLEGESINTTHFLKALLDAYVYTASDDGRCHLSRAQLAKKLRMTCPSYDRYRRKLEELDWIVVGRAPRQSGGQRANAIAVNWPRLREVVRDWRESTKGIGASQNRLPESEDPGIQSDNPPVQSEDPGIQIEDPYLIDSFHHYSTIATTNNPHEVHENNFNLPYSERPATLKDLTRQEMGDIGLLMLRFKEWSKSAPRFATERYRLMFVACAIRAREQAQKNPPGLFQSMLMEMARGNDPGITNADEQFAEKEIRKWEKSQRDRARLASRSELPPIQFRDPASANPKPQTEALDSRAGQGKSVRQDDGLISRQSHESSGQNDHLIPNKLQESKRQSDALISTPPKESKPQTEALISPPERTAKRIAFEAKLARRLAARKNGPSPPVRGDGPQETDPRAGPNVDAPILPTQPPTVNSLERCAS